MQRQQTQNVSYMQRKIAGYLCIIGKIDIRVFAEQYENIQLKKKDWYIMMIITEKNTGSAGGGFPADHSRCPEGENDDNQKKRMA